MPHDVVLIDAHVHLRRAHDPSVVLTSALGHFARSARRLGAARVQRVLMLTEAADEHAFERLASRDAPVGEWVFARGVEDESLRAEHAEGDEIFLIQGFQVQTHERLEMLTLGTSDRLPEGQPVRETLEMALNTEAVVALPWGFGKWTGSRRDLMLDLLDEFHERGLALGDSAHRPEGFPEGRVFQKARALKVPIVPGTDPLPIPAHAKRAGKYGLWLEGRLDSRTPAADLRSRLRGPIPRSSVIGRRDGLFGSLYAQAALRLRSGSLGDA